MIQLFQVGDKVRFNPDRHHTLYSDLPADGIFAIGAVIPFPLPKVERYEQALIEKKAGHPQLVFLEGVFTKSSFSFNFDPENKGRQAFSGAWFEKI